MKIDEYQKFSPLSVSSSSFSKKLNPFEQMLQKKLHEAPQEELKTASLKDPELTETQKKEEKKLRTAVQEFEAFFLSQLLKEMRKTIPDGGLFEDDTQKEKIYNDLLDEDMSRYLAKGKGMGLAESLYRQMSRSLSLSSDSTQALSDIVGG